MKERPILFSAPMVRAILEGRKTVTRRLVKGIALEWLGPEMFSAEYVASAENGLCPYGNSGDRLYVRETFWQLDKGYKPTLLLGAKERVTIEFDADLSDIARREFMSHRGYNRKPSLHLPKAGARIWLEVTAVRVERLQDITTEQILAEGIVSHLCEHDAVVDLRQQFEKLWDGLAKPGTRWADNPWVWVVEFHRITEGGKS